MTTKIDISSLDKKTKQKIDQMSQRCKELYQGVKRSTTIHVDYMVNWTDGTECDIVNFTADAYTPFKLHCDKLDQLTKELKKEVDKEIKEIIKFSDDLADKLGVDQTEFFMQYFAY